MANMPPPVGRSYPPVTPDRQPTRISGVVRTRPGVWRIAWGVCLGLFLFSIISSVIAALVVLVLGGTLGSDFSFNK